MAADLLATPTNLDLTQLKEGLFDNLRLRLGGDIIDLELDPDHYEAAYNYTIKLYRQRAQNATVESYTLMRVEKNVEILHLQNLALEQSITESQFGTLQGKISGVSMALHLMSTMESIDQKRKTELLSGASQLLKESLNSLKIMKKVEL